MPLPLPMQRGRAYAERHRASPRDSGRPRCCADRAAQSRSPPALGGAVRAHASGFGHRGALTRRSAHRPRRTARRRPVPSNRPLECVRGVLPRRPAARIQHQLRAATTGESSAKRGPTGQALIIPPLATPTPLGMRRRAAGCSRRALAHAARCGSSVAPRVHGTALAPAVPPARSRRRAGAGRRGTARDGAGRRGTARDGAGRQGARFGAPAFTALRWRLRCLLRAPGAAPARGGQVRASGGRAFTAPRRRLRCLLRAAGAAPARAARCALRGAGVHGAAPVRLDFARLRRRERFSRITSRPKSCSAARSLWERQRSARLWIFGGPPRA